MVGNVANIYPMGYIGPKAIKTIKKKRQYRGWVVATKNGSPHYSTFAMTRKDAQFNHQFNMKRNCNDPIEGWAKYEAQGLRVVRATLVIEE